MKVYDTVNKEEVEVEGTKGLIELMRNGRQVDLYLKEKKSDEDGYLTWDVEHWSSIDVKRFIRCYSLVGKVLGESTGRNIKELDNEFKPEEAQKVELSSKIRKEKALYLRKRYRVFFIERQRRIAFKWWVKLIKFV